jgi:hypothetical protein
LVNTARRADIVIRRPAMSTSIQSANECDRLPTLAADLVARELSLIAAISGPSALAAKIAIGPATRSISSAFSPRSTQKFQHCFVAWVAALTDVSADVIAFYNNIGHSTLDQLPASLCMSGKNTSCQLAGLTGRIPVRCMKSA